MPTTRIHAPTPRALRLLATALRRGELVAIPTETVYGLAAHALDARACRKIFTAKRRPADDPLIVHVPDLKAAEQLAEFNDAARALVGHFWPGPLTIVLPKKKIVPAIVTSGQDSVALRSPAHPLARKLLKLAGIPLAAPSANPFGYVSPTTAEHVVDGLGGRIKHVLDGGPCAVGVESTIVDARDSKNLRILRPGSISVRELTAVLRRAGLKGRVSLVRRKPAVLAPGLLDQHYSPHTPLSLVARIPTPARRGAGEKTALIYWKKPAGTVSENSFSLSTRGAPEEAAKKLYAALRQIDAGGFDRIVAESAPASAGALGIAINDRLARAAGKRAH
ncbi:MAG TPA: L-threonylcarbamoyladenylate synthase [Candidatus Didemnitutus sp.]|nr:L-threonylcarbamoyladenylate synthase [Candidatus Didemnitutus sp.]